MKCLDCGHDIFDDHQAEHGFLCCDCFDIRLGAPLEMINKEREAKGRPPIVKKPS